MRTGETGLLRSPAPAGRTERSRPRPAPPGPPGAPRGLEAGPGSGSGSTPPSPPVSLTHRPGRGGEAGGGGRARRVRGRGWGCGSASPGAPGLLWGGRAPRLTPRAAPAGRPGERGRSCLGMSEANLCLIASLKKKTSALPSPPPPRHAGFCLFLPVRKSLRDLPLPCSFTPPAPRSPAHNPRGTGTPAPPPSPPLHLDGARGHGADTGVSGGAVPPAGPSGSVSGLRVSGF